MFFSPFLRPASTQGTLNTVTNWHLSECVHTSVVYSSRVVYSLRVSGEGTVRLGHYRNYYKGHMAKIKGEGGGGGGRWVQLGWGRGRGKKGIEL